MGPTPTAFNSAYNVGDDVYIFFDDGQAGQVKITALNFREGFNPEAFAPATDWIYTTNQLVSGSITDYITREQQYCFATKNDMSAYVLLLP